MPSKTPSGSGLQLPKSTRDRAINLARRERITLDEFITLAVAEKVARMDVIDEMEPQPPSRPIKPV